MYAFAQTPLDEETIKLTRFSSGDMLFAFIQGFYGSKGLPNILQNKIRPSLKPLENTVLLLFTLMIFFIKL